MVAKNKLAGAIASKGLTQKKLAEMIGVSKNTISAKMNNKSSFDTDEIERICRVLGIKDVMEKANIFLANSSQNRDDSTNKAG